MNIYQRIVLILGAMGVFYVVFLINPILYISHVIFKLVGVVGITMLLYFAFSEGKLKKSLQKKLW